MEQIQTFLEYANSAAKKIREICHIFGGCGSPEEGTLLGDAYACIADMTSVYLSPITGKELYSDELNNMTVDILYADKNEISGIVRKYCKESE